MTPERWRQVEDVYEAVMARPAAERVEAMNERCAGDEGLRQEVEALLAHAGEASVFLETPAFAVADVAKEPGIIGRQFGIYLVQSALGTGGMGEVYRAHDGQLGREFAVKILPRLSRAVRRALCASSRKHECWRRSIIILTPGPFTASSRSRAAALVLEFVMAAAWLRRLSPHTAV